MEFTLQAAQGVPDGSVLSIKIGETKRQGPLSKLGQTFRFASSPAEPLPMRVEVLGLVGSPQFIDFTPIETSRVVDFGEGVKVTLSQRQAPELQRPLADMKSMVASGALTSDKLQMAQSAANYLEKHDLVRTFQDILHGMLVVKPADPIAYLEEHVARAKALVAREEKAPVTSTASAPQPSTTGSTQSVSTNVPRRGSINTNTNKVDALLDILKRTSRNLPLVMPFLPQQLHDVLNSRHLSEECHKQFTVLDTSKQGKLGPVELTPILIELSTPSSCVRHR
jgi:hypothetical protein